MLSVYNLTSLQLAIVGSQRRGSNIADISRGRSWSIPATGSGQQLQVVDSRSRQTLVEFTDTGADHVQVIDFIQITGWPATDPVDLLVANPTPFELSLEARPRPPFSGSAEWVAFAALGPGEFTTLRVMAGQAWTASAINTRGSAVLVDQYIVGGLDIQGATQTWTIQNCTIAFRNESAIAIVAKMILPAGRRSYVYPIGPGTTRLASNVAAQPWRFSVLGLTIGTLGASLQATTIPLCVRATLPVTSSAPLHLTFNNKNDFAISVEPLDAPPARRVTPTVINANQSMTVTTAPRQIWRIGEPDSGAELGYHVASADSDQQRDFVLTRGAWYESIIEFRNETWLGLDVLQPIGGVLDHLAKIGPRGELRLQTFVSTPLFVRDELTGTVLDVIIASDQHRVHRISNAQIRTIPGGEPVSLEVAVANQMAGDVLGINAHHQDASGQFVTTPPGRINDTATYATQARTNWWFTERGTGTELGRYICDDRQQQLSPPLHIFRSPLSTIETSLEFVNLTPTELNVFWLDRQGRQRLRGTIEPGMSVMQATFDRHMWALRPRARFPTTAVSAALVYAGREPRRIEVRPGHRHWAAEAPRPGEMANGSLTVSNNRALPIDIAWIDGKGDQHHHLTLQPGQSQKVDGHYGQSWIATSAVHPRAAVDMAIVGGRGDDTLEARPRIRVSQNHQQPVITLLERGEVMLFSEPGFTGTSVRITQALLDIATETSNALPVIRSLRLGPGTGVTVIHEVEDTDTATSATQASYDVDQSDLPSVSATRTACDPWRTEHPTNIGISSHAILTQEFRDQGATVEPYRVYRATISVPPQTQRIELRADRPTTIEVAGTDHQIGPDRSVNLTPNSFAKVLVQVRVDDLALTTKLDPPVLQMRSDDFPIDRHIALYLDAESHHRLASMPVGTIRADRPGFGISSAATDEECGHIERAIRNVGRTVGYGYEVHSHGVHHSRGVRAGLMEHPHWRVSLPNYSNDRPTRSGLRSQADFKALTTEEARESTKNATRMTVNADEGILDALSRHLKSALAISVHTVEAAATEVVSSGRQGLGDVVDVSTAVGVHVDHTSKQIGEDLVHGNVGGAVGDLVRGDFAISRDLSSGVYHVARDLFGGAAALTADAVSGAGRLLVLNIHTEREVLQYVLDHTGAVGRVTAELLGRISTSAEQAETHLLDWLLAKLPWPAIWTIAAEIPPGVDALLDHLDQQLADGTARVDAELDGIKARVNEEAAELSAWLVSFKPDAGPRHRSGPAATPHARSQVDWLLSKIEGSSPFEQHHADTFQVNLQPHADALIDDLNTAIPDASALMGRVLGDLRDDIRALFDGRGSPMAHLEAVVDLCVDVLRSASAGAGELVSQFVSILKQLLDKAFAFARQAITELRTLWNAPWPSDSHLSRWRDYARVEFNDPTLRQDGDQAGGANLSFLDFAAFLVAVPAAMLVQHELDASVAPRSSEEIPIGLPPDQISIRWGGVYAACHLVSPFVAIRDDIVAFELARANGPAPDAKVSFDRLGFTLNSLGLALGVFAQVAGSPMGGPLLHLPNYEHPATQERWIVPKAPGYYAFSIWIAQFIPVVVASVDAVLQIAGSKREWPADKYAQRWNTPVSALTGVWGLIHLFLMIVLDRSDETLATRLRACETSKPGFWNQPPRDVLIAIYHDDFNADQLNAFKQELNNDLMTDGGVQKLRGEAATLRGRLAWSNRGGIPIKTAGNAFDAVPEIAAFARLPIAAEASDGVSILLAAALSVDANVIEGVIYATRTAGDGLY